MRKTKDRRVLWANQRIVEATGLPGSGKTTVLNLLLKRLGSHHRAGTRSVKKRLQSFCIHKLFMPITLVMFSPVFRCLHRNEPGTSVHFVRWVFSLMLKAMSGQKKPIEGNNEASFQILTFLNDFVFEYVIASLEAALLRKNFVMDEGFVQGGIGVWLRAPKDLKKTLWDAFFASIKGKVRCLLFDCSPDSAMQRMQIRARGDRAVRRWLGDSDFSEFYLDMARLLSQQMFSKNIDCIRIATIDEPEKICDAVVESLQTIKPLDEWLIFARN